MRFRNRTRTPPNLAMCIAFLIAVPCANAELQNVKVGADVRISGNYFSQYDVLMSQCVWGLVDKDGNVVFEPTYAGVDEFSEGLAAVTFDPTWSRPRMWGFADTTGNVVIQTRYDQAGEFSEGLAAVRTETGWGYIDRSGNWIIPPQFEAAGPFSSGLAIVRAGGIPGIIDQSGNVNYLPDYDAAWGIGDGWVCVKKDKRCGFVNLLGDRVIPLEFEAVSQFQNGAAPVKQGDAWGLIDTHGEFIAQPAYQMLHGYPGGIFCATRPGSAGVIDAKGNTIVHLEFKENIPEITPYFALIDGLLQLNAPLSTKRPYFNLAGQQVFELSNNLHFDNANADGISWNLGFFQEGRSRIQVHGLEGVSYGGFGAFGFIDMQGVVVIDPVYARVKRFSDGVAWVAMPRPAE